MTDQNRKMRIALNFLLNKALATSNAYTETMQLSKARKIVLDYIEELETANHKLEETTLVLEQDNTLLGNELAQLKKKTTTKAKQDVVP